MTGVVADNSPLTGADGVRFADAGARALLSEHLAALRDPAAGGFERVKHNVSRTVYRGQVGGVEIYVKHFHPRSLWHRLLRRLGVSGALREMRWGTYLAGNGVRTPTPLAAACADGVEWVATRAVSGAAAGDKWHEDMLHRGPSGRAAVRRGIVALAEMVGKMHAAGIRHCDLHCGNILVRGGDRAELVLMDLHRARRSRRLKRSVRAANLAQLLYDRYDFTTRSERLLFLKHYLRASGAGGTLRGWQTMIEYLASRHGARQFAQRDRRVFARNRYFSPVRLAGGWRGHVVQASKRRMAGSRAGQAELSAEGWTRALADPDSLTKGDGVTIVKNSPSSLVVRRTLTVDGHAIDVYIKRRRRKRAWKALADCFRRSRPLRAFALGHALLTRRIATALPLAALERRTGPLLRDSLLVTEAVDAPSLREFMRRWLSFSPRGDAQLSAAQQHHLAQQVLWQLGRVVQGLHDHRFAHRDLKATNLLVRWSPGTDPQIVLIDLDGLTRRRVLTSNRRFQGLMRLNVSLLQCPEVNHAGRLRMLLGYLRRPGCGRITFKPYWRVLEKWSDRKLARQIRSRRRRQRATRRPAP